MTVGPVGDHPRGRSVAIAVIVAVAIACGLAGAAIDRAYTSRSMRFVGDTGFHPLSSALRTPTDAERREARAELSTALTLTPDQNRVIDSIMSSRAGQFDALRQTMRPQVESLLAEVRGDVEKVLTPEQRARYRKLQGRPVGDGSSK